nr:hypothetical protein [Tanacetum cinerariifolium]
MMSFLTAVVTSRYPPTNNQLRNSSNPRQQATINNGRVTVQLIHRRQNSLAAGMSRQYTSGPSGNNSGKQRVVVCYNCKGEGHMSKQCTKPKRKRDEAWFKDKDNKSVNEILTAELERYKHQVRILKEGNNVGNASVLCAQSLKIDNLKHTLSEHLKEKESLEQMNYVNFEEPNLSTRPTQVEVPKELPKVSMSKKELLLQPSLR